MWFQTQYPDSGHLACIRDNDNEDMPSTLEGVVKNIIEEIQSVGTASRKLAYNTGKLNLDIIRKEQQ